MGAGVTSKNLNGFQCDIARHDKMGYGVTSQEFKWVMVRCHNNLNGFWCDVTKI